MADEIDGTVPTSEELAQFATAPSRGDGGAYYREIQGRLARHPEEGRRLIERLTEWPKTDVRAWAAVVGARLFGQDFIPTLVRLMNSGNTEVESVALMLLTELSPAAVDAQLPTLRRKLLRLKDPDDVLQLMWVMARLRDIGALPAVRSLTTRPEPYVREMADVLADFLEHGEQAVMKRIAEHDHAHMVALCRLAWHVGTEEALQAIQTCAQSAPDDECRKTCARFARSLESIRGRHQPPFWDESAPE